METCVLIPQEFSLVLTASDGRMGKKKIPEMGVNVWTNAKIPQGTLIYPFQGTIRLDKLEVYSYLSDNDVSYFVYLLFLLDNLFQPYRFILRF